MRVAACSMFALLAVSASCYAEDTAHYVVLTEFVRELVETKANEDIAKSELASAPKDSPQDATMAIIRNGTRVKLSLSAAIARLQEMHLSEPFETLIPLLTANAKQKLLLYDDMVDTAKTFSVGPQAGVEYGKLAAHMPEITASIEYVDESKFKLVPLVFFAVISDKPDSKNHLSHLSITRRQTEDTLRAIKRGFGTSLDAKEQNWTVSSASVLRTYLRDKGYKFSDDAWQ